MQCAAPFQSTSLDHLASTLVLRANHFSVASASMADIGILPGSRPSLYCTMSHTRAFTPFRACSGLRLELALVEEGQLSFLRLLSSTYLTVFFIPQEYLRPFTPVRVLVQIVGNVNALVVLC